MYFSLTYIEESANFRFFFSKGIDSSAPILTLSPHLISKESTRFLCLLMIARIPRYGGVSDTEELIAISESLCIAVRRSKWP
jgi:hypothetical protein